MAIRPSCSDRTAGFVSSWMRALCVLAFVVVLLASPAAVAATHCGLDGERACCLFSTERETYGACEQDAIEVPGCSGDCACGGDGPAVWFGSHSSGTCEIPVHCGLEGERACCVTEGRFPENPVLFSAGCEGTAGGGIDNLAEIAGGVPDPGVCGTWADNPFGWSSNGHCAKCGSEGARVCVQGTAASLGFYECMEGLTNISGWCATCGGEDQPMCISNSFMCLPGFHPDGGFCTADRTIDEPDCNCTPIPLAQKEPVPDVATPVDGYADLHMHLFANMGFGGMVVWGDFFDPQLGISGALRSDNFVQRNADVQIQGYAQKGINDTTVGWDFFRKQTLLHGDNHFDDLIDKHRGAGLAYGGGVEWDRYCLSCGNPIQDFTAWPKWDSITHQSAYYVWLQRAHRGGLQLIVNLAVTNEGMCAANRHLKHPEYDCADTMASIEHQLRKAYEFQDWNNRQCLNGWLESQSGDPVKGAVQQDRHCAEGGGPAATGWFRIVTEPLEARQAIASGQLAVVLGIEESALFGYKRGVTPSLAEIDEQITKFHDLGVRHVFPIHNNDNAFGGSATWDETIAVSGAYANRGVESNWPVVEACPATPSEFGANGYGRELYDTGKSLISGVISTTTFGLGAFYPADTGLDATCNRRGLTGAGADIIRRLMKAGMIIDVDHMSNHSFDDTLQIAEDFDYPGIVASHALMFDLTVKGQRHERMRTKDQLIRIARLGGMVGVMTQPPENDIGNLFGDLETTILNYPGSRIYNNCQASSKTFGQAYEWARDVMGPEFPAGKPFGVAFGTDFNGISAHNAPRYGPDACGDELDAAYQQPIRRMQYPFTLRNFGQFEKQTTSNRTFDYNDDGLAHVGLLPDMIFDLKKLGISREHLDALFNSAEAYIAMWEGTIPAAAPIVLPDYSSDVTPPTTTASIAGVPLTPDLPELTTTWFTTPGPITVDFEAIDENGQGSGIESIYVVRKDARNHQREDGTPYLGFTNPISDTTNETQLSLDLYAEGWLSIDFFATDLANNVENLKNVRVGLDWTPPVVTLDIFPTPTPAGWFNRTVSLDPDCTDNVSNMRYICLYGILLDQEGVVPYSVSYQDHAGNTSNVVAGSVQIDLTPPETVATATPPKNTYHWFKDDVVLTYDCVDPISSGVASGIDVCPPGETITTEGERNRVQSTSTDLAGNSSGFATLAGTNESIVFVRLDKTPATVDISVTAEPGANSATVDLTCTDALSGVLPQTCRDKVVSLLDADPTYAGTVLDVAGNETPYDIHVFDYLDDPVPPTITGYLTPLGSSGWTNQDVNGVFDCDDNRVVSSCGPNVTLTGEGPGQTITGVAVDGAGNTSPPLVLGPIGIDKTPPVIQIASATPRPDLGYGVYDVAFSCSDALSPVIACSNSFVFNALGPNPTALAVAYDAANNQTILTVTAAMVHTADTTDPTITASIAPAANAAGWHKAGAVVSFDCQDAHSGIPAGACPTDQTLAVDGADQTISGSVSDAEGNGPVSTSITVDFDGTPPAITTETITTGPGADEVTITFSCTDATSGVATCQAPMTLATAPTPEVGTATATDVAGNVGTIEVSTEGADLVPPTIYEHYFLPGAGNDPTTPRDWYTLENLEYIDWFCDDDQPGVTCSPRTWLAGAPQGPGVQFTGEAVDAAGNRVTKTVSINIDFSKPEVVWSHTPGPNANGWFNSDVLFTYACNDPESGMGVCPVPVLASGDGINNSSPSIFAQNNAGTMTGTIDLIVEQNYPDSIPTDRTPPTLSLQLLTFSTPPNAWIRVVCNDPPRSGSFDKDRSYMQECEGAPASGTSQETWIADTYIDMSTGVASYTATGTDRAGNVGSLVVDLSGHQYETAAPIVSVVATPPPNLAGWNNTDVAIDFQCTDVEGHLRTCAGDTTLTAEGANQYVAGYGLDYWNNRTDVDHGPVHIDKTVPTVVAIEFPGVNPWEARVSFDCADDLSGVLACDPSVDVVLGYGNIPITGGATDFAGNVGTDTITIDGCQRGCDADCNGYVDERDVVAIDAAEGSTVLVGDVRDTDDDGVLTANDTYTCALGCDQMGCAEIGGPAYDPTVETSGSEDPIPVPEPGVTAGLIGGCMMLWALARRRGNIGGRDR